MKLAIFIITCVAFIGLSAFGMLTMQMEGHGNCMVSALQGADCPVTAWSFSTITEHFSVFGTLSIALIILAGVTFLCSYWLIRANKSLRAQHAVFYALPHGPEFSGSFQQKLLGWISLHENSPSFA